MGRSKANRVKPEEEEMSLFSVLGMHDLSAVYKHVSWIVPLATPFLPVFCECLFFLLVDGADLQRHQPAVLEESGRGVGCGGKGRSVPIELLLPLGGALSLHWW